MISKSDADLIMSSFNITDNDVKYSNNIENELYNLESICLFLDRYIMSTQFCTPWCKLYRRDLIDDLRFNERISLAEDTIFVFGYICRIKSVRTIKDFSYQYNRGVIDSLSVRYRTIDEYSEIIKENYNSLYCVERQFDYNGEEIRFIRTLVIFKLCLDVIKLNKKSIKETYKDFKELLKIHPVEEMLKYKNHQHKGPRRRFFDFLAFMRCYCGLFVYVIYKKGFIY